MSLPLIFLATTSTGDFMWCIDVNITDDSVFEESETFTVTVTTTNPQVTLRNDNTTVNITDNEGRLYICGTRSEPENRDEHSHYCALPFNIPVQ